MIQFFVFRLYRGGATEALIEFCKNSEEEFELITSNCGILKTTSEIYAALDAKISDSKIKIFINLVLFLIRIIGVRVFKKNDKIFTNWKVWRKTYQKI